MKKMKRVFCGALAGVMLLALAACGTTDGNSANTNTSPNPSASASGGSDFVSKNQKPESDNSFGGGSGAGMNLSPVAFLIIKGDTVKLMPVAAPPCNTVDRVVELVPEVIDKVTDFVEKQQDKKAGNSSPF